jgi:hypothetical protein
MQFRVKITAGRQLFLGLPGVVLALTLSHPIRAQSAPDEFQTLPKGKTIFCQESSSQFDMNANFWNLVIVCDDPKSPTSLKALVDGGWEIISMQVTRRDHTFDQITAVLKKTH